jgi:hypothetical protein
MKVYTICEINFEYNDEYYYSHEDAGFVRKGFRSEEKAREECNRLNRARQVMCNPACYSGEDCPFNDDQLEQVREIMGPGVEINDVGDVYDEWDQLSNEVKLKLWAIAENAYGHFFQITEMEVEDCQVR